MAIRELFSTRNKAAHPDVYQYDTASSQLRHQASDILTSTIGLEHIGSYHRQTLAKQCYGYMFHTLKREYGEPHLNGYWEGDSRWFGDYLVSVSETDRFLDLVELACDAIDRVLRHESDNLPQDRHLTPPDEALQELNERMKRAGFGYEYTNGIIVRVDEQYLHSEVVKPAIHLLQDFAGAQQEFLSAHEHYRHGRYEESITDCCKSFESLMKTICKEKNWITTKEMASLNASQLIAKCIDNGLIPNYMQTYFSGFRQLLESGVPTIRNKNAGHGTGEVPREVPQELVSYALHLTATNIVFLGNCYHNM